MLLLLPPPWHKCIFDLFLIEWIRDAVDGTEALLDGSLTRTLPGQGILAKSRLTRGLPITGKAASRIIYVPRCSSRYLPGRHSCPGRPCLRP